MKIAELRLKKNLSRSPEQNFIPHPWFFKNSIEKIPENSESGIIAKLFDKSGNFICYGFFNPKSNICLRAVSWKENEFPDHDFICAKIATAYDFRKNLKINSDSFRLFFSESDGLPGLIIDKFANFAVIQTNTAAVDKIKNYIAEFIIKSFNIAGVIERNDCEIRSLEMLPIQKSLLRGENPPDDLIITENDSKFYVNLLNGQKTGFYLDQRDNRAELAKFAKPGMEILDAFCFCGAFSVYAARSAENLTLHLLDDSEFALKLAKKNLELNQINTNLTNFHRGNAFSILRKFRDSRKSFDMIILDPPKFAPTRKDSDKATRGYKDINLLAMKILRKNGILASFSCSSGISPEKFRQIIINAARDARREFKILKTLGHSADHPIPLNFPEAEYLKGLICKVEE